MLMNRTPPPEPVRQRQQATKEQLSFPYRRSPAWRGISPSGMTKAQNPIAFYFQYVGPKEYKPLRTPQTVPMAAGASLDGILKQRLIADDWKRNRRSFYRKKVNRRSFSVCGTVDRHNWTPAVLTRVRETEDAFFASGAYDYLREFEVIDLEADRKKATWVNRAPLNGKLDFLFDDTGERIVSDLKVNGAFSKSGTSPVQGYTKRWDVTDCGDPTVPLEVVECPPHKRAGEPLEELNWGFAAQMGTYALMEQAEEKGPLFVPERQRVVLVQVTYRPATDKIVITLIDTYLSAEFLLNLNIRYANLWTSVQDRTLIPQEYALRGIDRCVALINMERLPS